MAAKDRSIWILIVFLLSGLVLRRTTSENLQNKLTFYGGYHTGKNLDLQAQYH